MPERERIDVGIVTWNTAELTLSALRRLLDVDHGCDMRVLVHDNASSDGTPEAISQHAPEVDLETSEDNLGFAKAMNRLIARSSASWFLALNSDAWPEPGAIEALLAAARGHPRAAAVAPLLLRPDGSVEHSTHAFPSTKVALLDAVGGRHWLPKRMLDRLCLEGSWNHDRPRRVDWAVGAALLMRRDAIAELGGFDERFFMYVEDLAWCWRATRAGWEIRFEPRAVVRHVGNVSGSKRWGAKRTALEARNLRLLLPEVLGRRRAAAFRALQSVAAAEQWAIARWRGKSGEAGRWRAQLKAQLGFEEAPVTHTPPKTVADPSGGGRPRVAVVVPTCGRAVSLERLLGALEFQSLHPDDFEVIVVDDCSPDDTAEILSKVLAGTRLNLRVLRQEVRRGPAAARNRGWNSTSAPLVAFTDDDCVPDAAWLESALAVMGDAPRVVAGRTEAPPEQQAMKGEPFSRFVEVDSARFLETCNVLYRRCDLEAVGGFDEKFGRPSGEDTRLGLAVTDLGVEPVFAAEAVVYHDVREGNLLDALRETLRWSDLPLVLKGHPGARGRLTHRWVFWKSTHPPAIAAACALVGIKWRPAVLLLLPWLYHRLAVVPACADPKKRVSTLPGALALDLCEVATMLRGSWRHRSILL